MNRVEIPERAVHAAINAAINADTAILTLRETTVVCLEEAAPIIIADAYRQLAARYERRADSCPLHRDGRGQETRSTFLRCADEARVLADELDPPPVVTV